VEDTVDGFIKALVVPKIEGEVINIGSGFEISIGNLAHMIAELLGTKIAIKESSERVRPADSEVERLLADNQKAKELLKWSPKNSGEAGLRLGLIQTIEWFRNPENLKRYKAENYNV
jgi:dTDP-glucose 4,6-dehydratase